MILTPFNCFIVAVLILAASIGMYAFGVFRGIRHEREQNNHALNRLWYTIRDSDTRPDALDLISTLLKGGHRR